MCDDYDPEQPYVDYRGIHYYGGHFQPYLPTLNPPEPKRADIRLHELNEIFMKAMGGPERMMKMFERDDAFYKWLKG